MKKILVFILILCMASSLFANDAIIEFIDELVEKYEELTDDMLFSAGFIESSSMRGFFWTVRGNTEILLILYGSTSYSLYSCYFTSENELENGRLWGELVRHYTKKYEYVITSSKNYLKVEILAPQPFSLSFSLKSDAEPDRFYLNINQDI